MDEAVRDLLHRAGVSRDHEVDGDVKVLAYADRESKSMATVYDTVNSELRDDIAHSGAMRIVHITGEARVLVDPQARDVIRASWNSRVSTDLILRQRSSTIEDASTMLGAVRDDWHGITHADLLDICSLARSGALKISVIPSDPPVHFSLFGRDRILIQEPQTDKTELKRIWFLRNESIAAALTLTAQDYFSTATALAAMSFGTLHSWLMSDEVQRLIIGEGYNTRPAANIPASDLDYLRRAGFVYQRENATATIRCIRRGAPATPSTALKDHLLSATKRRHEPPAPGASDDSWNSVLLLHAKEVENHWLDAVTTELSRHDFVAYPCRQYLITDDQIVRALGYPRLLSIVTSVGTAAETLHLLNFARWQTLQKRSGDVDQLWQSAAPDVRILVPNRFFDSYFSRVAAESYRLRVRHYSDDSILSLTEAIGEVAGDWLEVERAEEVVRHYPRRAGMDEQSRRAREPGFRSWSGSGLLDSP